MTTHSDTQGNHSAPDMDAGDAMGDQLRGDVASWMVARTEAVDRASIEAAVPPPRVATPKPAARARQAKAAAAAAQSAVVKKKPFGMSYDGMSQADYITYMISRGAR